LPSGKVKTPRRLPGRVRQKDLEIRLARVPAHPAPKPGLEQYSTPAPIAAGLLYRALAAGDIRDRRVLDLGCGTGVLAIGAALLGATVAVGVDVDAEAVAAARASSDALGSHATFHEADVATLSEPFDTVVMNPPFGAQFAARGADVQFLKAALTLAPVCYSLHATKTRDHLLRTIAALDATPQVLTTYAFPLPHQFRFHRKEKVVLDVDLLRSQRMG
jgi:putative methylase